MDINFLIEKWKEFENDEKAYSKCLEYRKAREKNILKTNKLVKDFIINKIDIQNLREGINSLYEYEFNIEERKIVWIWGLGGFKGMILLNMLINYASDRLKMELNEILRKSFIVPGIIEEAKFKIDFFAAYIEKFKESTEVERKIKSFNKDLEHTKIALNPTYSYTIIPGFWSMQELDKFPVYYTSCEKIIKNLDEKDKYYKKSISIGGNYELFYNFNVKLIDRLQEKYKRKLSFSDVSTDYLDYIYKKYLEDNK